MKFVNCSETNRVTSAIDVMVTCAKDLSAIFRSEAHGPFVPNLGLRIVTPETDFYFLPFSSHERISDGEVEREPGMHTGCVSNRLNTVVYFLV